MTRKKPQENHRGPALCLDLGRQGANLRVAISERRGDWTPQGFEVVEVDFDEVTRITEDLAFLLERGNLFGEIGAAAASEIERLSLLLFDELLPPRLKPLLRRGEGALTLRLDESLQHIPWELLHTGEQFLAQQYVLSREVMRHGIAEPAPTRELGPQRRVLILCDPRDDLPASAREGLLLREAFTLREDIEMGYKGAPVRRSDVRENLREYDIVHFAGHAEWDEGGGGWLLEDGRFEPRDIQRLAGARPLPSLVFVNACASGSAPGPAHRHMAHALLAAGVRHVIGTLWDLPDSIGILFAHCFYEHLLRGESIGEAMRRTRSEMAERYGEGTVLWGSYVLYGPPEVTYFDAVPEPAPCEQEPSPLALATLPTDPRSPIDPSPRLRSSALALPAVPVPPRGHGSLLMFALVAVAAGLIGWLMARSTTPRPPSSASATAPAIATVAPTAIEDETPNWSTDAGPLGRLEVYGRSETEGALRLREGASLAAGTPFQLRFQVDRDAHSHVLYLRPNGHAQQLFPRLTGDYGEVTGDVEIHLPAMEHWYWPDPEPGLAAIVLLTTPQPIEDLPGLVAELSGLVNEAAPRSFAPPDEVATPIGRGLQTIPVDTLRARLQRDGAHVEVFELHHH